MLGIHEFWLFIISGLLLNITPGPDTAYIIGRSVQMGWRGGAAAALGICTGCLVHVFAAAVGLSAKFGGKVYIRPGLGLAIHTGSTENFQDLQSQLEGTENRINVARDRYNESIRSYNTFVRGFFTRMALSWFGGGQDFSVRKGFSAAEGSDKAPEVKF